MATQTKTMQELWQDSYLGSGNEAYLEALYEDYLRDPANIDPTWRQFFDNLAQQVGGDQADVSHDKVREHFLQLARNSAKTQVAKGMDTVHDQQQELVIELITAYRRLGHLQATTDPLELKEQIYSASLELGYYGFNKQDLTKKFNTSSFAGLGKPSATLSEIHEGLRRIYCRSIGFEYMHINRSDEVDWLRQRIEHDWANFKIDNGTKKRILDRLVVADGLEKYLGFKYVGQKRFSLEGGDGLIPMLDTIINNSVQDGVKEIVIGMAHRGRLNVLANVVGKPTRELFDAFEGKGIPSTHSGDVKYHLGASCDVVTSYGTVHVSLSFNPSHLEIVSPVVQGSVRSRQRRRRDSDQRSVVPIQIHGDAAFAGQGVVMETFNMSQARWFTVGGSIHLVINNQIGFTISNPEDSRSTIYPTDVAKMVEAPILHVNANDAEAVYFAGLLAAEYRSKFKRDVVIDLVCYRRQGHNEADEPSATQPVMYKKIRAMKPAYKIYAQQLLEAGVIEAGDEKRMVDNYRDALDEGRSIVETAKDRSAYEYAVKWQPFLSHTWDEKTDTAVPAAKLKEIGKRLEQLPEGFKLQAQVRKMWDVQKKMTEGEAPINWGYAEMMAFATLLDQGYPIRLCGQDANRGTFAHRHAVLHEQETDDIYIPLSHISPNQAQINIVDSLLSEEAVLAFEYGYATAEPNFLVMWEAQFGDFANGAQVVIDQFLSSGEQKWGRLCGLVMLLPHGYEGIGPEHSSARLERYLQLCAQENMQVCSPTTPAQMFHLLRRQMIRPYRKPLIIMTPKSSLRNPLAVSQLDDLSEGKFHYIIPEVDDLESKNVDRVVICCGKVYYELLQQRRDQKKDNVALIRVEQLYPFAEDAMREILKPYKHVKQFVWCQEEPENQGAWGTIQPYLLQLLQKGQVLEYAGRVAAASPASGYHSVHEKEQAALIADALTN